MTRSPGGDYGRCLGGLPLRGGGASGSCSFADLPFDWVPETRVTAVLSAGAGRFGVTDRTLASPDGAGGRRRRTGRGAGSSAGSGSGSTGAAVAIVGRRGR